MRHALSRAVTAYRVLALGYAVALAIADHGDYSRPALGWTLLAVMAGWTVAMVVAYEIRPQWPAWLLTADVAVAVGMVLATIAVQPHARIVSGAPTLPAAWAAAPVLACAVAGGPMLGGLAGLAVSVADVVERGAITQHTFNGVVLLLIAGVLGGYVVQLGRRAEVTIETATRRVSAAAERDRLAREIHDSTLQLLALVARRGTAIGGEAVELARLAAEQEVALRHLMASPPVGPDEHGHSDLGPMLSALATPSVTVSAPAGVVALDDGVALALTAAVAEALLNVARHAGAGARAWVLLEHAADAVTVSVRDDGVGIGAGRLAEAGASGRLGVTQSILGRIEAIGGVATVTSTPGAGTEVEIRVPC